MLTDKSCSPQGLTPELFQRHFEKDKQCFEALVALRWPKGFVCPHCGGRKHSYIKGTGRFQCSACRKQSSVRTGTFMEQSRTTLSNWFLAIYLIEGSENRIKNSKLAEALEVKVDTARLIRKKFLAARRFHSLNIGGAQRLYEHLPEPHR